MSQDTLFPLGEFGFLINPIDRAAHLRDDAEKLFALEGRPNSRAYVIHRDSVLMRQDGDEVRAALTIKEALGFGANPGTIFIGLRDGAPYFGMGIPQQAAEKLAGRNDVVVEPLRNVASQGIVPPSELAAVAVAKSLVHFHQRHGFCSNCGSRSQMAQGGWKRECPNCKTEIRLTESLAAPLVQEMRKQYEGLVARKEAEVSQREVAAMQVKLTGKTAARMTSTAGFGLTIWRVYGVPLPGSR